MEWDVSQEQERVEMILYITYLYTEGQCPAQKRPQKWLTIEEYYTKDAPRGFRWVGGWMCEMT